MSTGVQDQRFGIDFLETITDWIAQHMEPSQVFDDKKLREWALENGFQEEE